MMGQDQPADSGSQGWQVLERRGITGVDTVFIEASQPNAIIATVDTGEASQPGGVVVITDEGLKQPQGNPFVSIEIPLQRRPWLKFGLKAGTGFAQIVHQRCEPGQQGYIFASVPIIFVISAQHITPSSVGGYSPLWIEAAGVADNPNQLTVIAATNPVASHRSIPTGILTQHPA